MEPETMTRELPLHRQQSSTSTHLTEEGFGTAPEYRCAPSQPSFWVRTFRRFLVTAVFCQMTVILCAIGLAGISAQNPCLTNFCHSPQVQKCVTACITVFQQIRHGDFCFSKPPLTTTTATATSTLTTWNIGDFPVSSPAWMITENKDNNENKDSGESNDCNENNDKIISAVTAIPADVFGNVVEPIPTEHSSSIEHLSRQQGAMLAHFLFEEAVSLLEKDPAGSIGLILHAMTLCDDQEIPISLPQKHLLQTAMYRWNGTVQDRDRASTVPNHRQTENVAINSLMTGNIHVVPLGNTGKFVTSDSDNKVWLSEVVSAKTGQTYRWFLGTAPRNIRVLRSTADGYFAVLGLDDGTVCFWNISAAMRGGLAPVILPERVSNLCDLQLSADGKWIAGFGNPTLAGKLDHVAASHPQARQPASKTRLQLPETWAEHYRDTNYDISAVRHEVYLWKVPFSLHESSYSLPSVTPAMLLRGHEKPVTSVTFDSRGKRLATTGGDATIRIFDLESEFPAAKQIVLKGHSRPVTSVMFDCNDRWVATGSEDGSVRIWEYNHFQSVPYVLTQQPVPVMSLSENGDGSVLTAGFTDGRMMTWQTDFRSQPMVITTSKRPDNSDIDLTELRAAAARQLSEQQRNKAIHFARDIENVLF